MKFLKITSVFVFSLAFVLSFSSCDNFFDIDAEEVVENGENYQNVYDADNAIWGLYGKLALLAENVVVLNELRADLMDVTSNATADQIALNDHTATAENAYCDPAPFYDVILNANDIIYNFDKMLAENKITKENYDPRYSDVVAIRCWTYLQLAIHFKDVPYVTDPLMNISDLNDNAKFPVKNIDELIPVLIQALESVPTLEDNTLSSFYNKSIQDNGKSFNLNMQLINKRLVLADLYLWNNQYVQAATQYKAFITNSEIGTSKSQIKYKVSGWVWAGTNEPRFQICYQRYKDQDVTSFRNMWKEMFYRSSTDVATSGTMGLQDEMIWMMSFSGSANSYSPFVKLFANSGQGEYQLKPSAYSIDSLWETQVQQSNGFVFDGRGRESSFDVVNGEPVVLKYLYDYYNNVSTDANKTIHLNYNLISNPYSKPGKWFLYRAATLHLRYAEAANRAGYPRLAYALLNNGIKANYDWARSNGTLRVDKEGVQYTSYPPVDDVTHARPYPEPFYLDARQNDVPYTFLRSPWRDNTGIRSRAFLLNVPKPDWVVSTADSIAWLEDAIINEMALECGFEGYRWGDLLRIARRNSKEDGKGAVTDLMKNAIKPKFDVAGKGVPNITNSNLFLPMKK
jgi:starch-binding outer membrane protein, SusD/RagB family